MKYIYLLYIILFVSLIGCEQVPPPNPYSMNLELEEVPKDFKGIEIADLYEKLENMESLNLDKREHETSLEYLHRLDSLESSKLSRVIKGLAKFKKIIILLFLHSVQDQKELTLIMNI